MASQVDKRNPTTLPEGSGLRIGIVAARWHANIVDRLLDGAQETLLACGVKEDHIHVVRCEGAYELPVIASAWAHKHNVDAIICLAAVIRGETPHFDYVAGPVSFGLTDVAVQTLVPCILGVLTTETLEQAHERAGGAHGNKGSDAAIAAIDTAHTIRSFR